MPLLSLAGAVAATAFLSSSASAQNCSDLSFDNMFNNKTAWQQDFRRTSSRGLGTVIPQDDGEGTALTITTDEPGSVTLQSYAWFMPPATFEFDMEASDVQGVISAITVWSGFSGGTPEIDLELLGWDQKRSEVMHPIWARRSEEDESDPIGLADGPEGWPSSDNGPTANYVNGWTPPPYNRYVANQTGFDNTARHTYRFDWEEDSMKWSIDGTEMVTFTKGSDDSEWINGPLPISVGLWAGGESQAGWMGEYNYDEDAQPTLIVYSVSAQGCSVNTTEEIEAARDSAFSLSASPFLALTALVSAGLWILA